MLQAQAKRSDGGSEIVFTVIGEAYVERNTRFVRRQHLRFSQFRKSIVPTLLAHIVNTQVDVRSSGTWIEGNDAQEILFRDRELTIAHGLRAVAKDHSGIVRRLRRWDGYRLTGSHKRKGLRAYQ